MQAVIADPFDCLESWWRFQHRDLAGLNVDELRAESAMLRRELQARLFFRSRPRGIFISPQGELVHDVEWLRLRIHLLTQEERRRLDRHRQGDE